MEISAAEGFFELWVAVSAKVRAILSLYRRIEALTILIFTQETCTTSPFYDKSSLTHIVYFSFFMCEKIYA